MSLHWNENHWFEDHWIALASRSHWLSTVIGYLLYRGTGNPAAVDFETIVATANMGQTTITGTGLTHTADTTYRYVLRPTLDTIIGPDLSCFVDFAVDADGDWVGNRPAKVAGIEATAISDGEIRLRWRYDGNTAFATPTRFDLWCSSSPEFPGGTPDATEAYVQAGYYQSDFALTDGVAYWFWVAAATAANVGPTRGIGPIIADATAPDAPDVEIDSTP